MQNTQASKSHDSFKILAINPCLRTEAKRRYPPVGLTYVLTMLKRAGYSFDLIDMDINKLTVDDVKNMLVGKTYDVVALGCIVTGLAQVKKLAEIAREKSPHCTIIAGNSVATSIPELLLTNTEVDIAVMGEGDVTIVELMDALRHARNWKNIPGIAYLEKEQLVLSPKRKVIPTLDSIGFPDWTLFEIEKYNTGQMDRMNAGAEKQIAFPLNAARGCPFNCTFCYHCFKGEKYRKYSEEAVFAEFIRLHDQFGANRIMLWDELTFPNIRTVERMADQLENFLFQFLGKASHALASLTPNTHSLSSVLKNLAAPRLPSR